MWRRSWESNNQPFDSQTNTREKRRVASQWNERGITSGAAVHLSFKSHHHGAYQCVQSLCVGGYWFVLSAADPTTLLTWSGISSHSVTSPDVQSKVTRSIRWTFFITVHNQPLTSFSYKSIINISGWYIYFYIYLFVFLLQQSMNITETALQKKKKESLHLGLFFVFSAAHSRTCRRWLETRWWQSTQLCVY